MIYIRWVLMLALAFGAGELVRRIKLPAILGWLICGMLLGPHGLNLMPQTLIDDGVYKAIIQWMQVSFGVMLGSELIWKRLKRYGRELIVTTLWQSLSTFVVVSLAFSLICVHLNMPIYVGFIFGGIALATAPAPALSIVREFHTSGPVTDTLIPMTILDDVVGIVVFFSVNAVATAQVSGQGGAALLAVIPVMIFLPIILGIVVGIPCARLLRQVPVQKSIYVLLGFVTLTDVLGWFFQTFVLTGISLNFMLMGVAFAATFANLVDEQELDPIVQRFNPVLNISILAAIVDLGAPLDYHLIMGAGVYTAVYIIARAIGKYGGARIGATIMHMPETVQKYLGLTLLPHSGVSLVFTGIACATLAPLPDCVSLVQGTIAAAAVINEIIAVILAKKGFEKSGEIRVTSK